MGVAEKSRMWREIYDQPQVLQNLLDKSKDKLRELGRTVHQFRFVYLIGTGASLNACQAARYAFLDAGLCVHVVGASNMEHYLPVISAQDLVILVSQSGESHETKQVVSMLSGRGTRLWGITNNAVSSLANSADEVLLLEAGEEVSSATKTHTATLLTLFLLAQGAGEYIGKPQLREVMIDSMPEQVSETLALTEAILPKLASWLESEDVYYVLGLGIHSPTASQAALMIKEKALQFVEGMQLAEFRHGPVEVIKPGLPIVITCSGSEECLAQAHMHSTQLTSMGAEVVVFAESHSVSPDGFAPYLITGGFCSDFYSHITAVVPYQLLAEELATRKGLDVDGFKNISKVVDKY